MAPGGTMHSECSNQLPYNSDIKCVKCHKSVSKGIQTCPECQSWLHGDCLHSEKDAIKVCWDSQCIRESDATPPLNKARLKKDVIECLLNDFLNAKRIIKVLRTINSELESELLCAMKPSAITVNSSVSTKTASFEFTKPKYQSNNNHSRHQYSCNPIPRPIHTQNSFTPLVNMTDFPPLDTIVTSVTARSGSRFASHKKSEKLGHSPTVT